MKANAFSIGRQPGFRSGELKVPGTDSARLDRVIDVDYLVDGTPDHEETFVMDTLGNRTGNQTLSEGAKKKACTDTRIVADPYDAPKSAISVISQPPVTTERIAAAVTGNEFALQPAF